MNRLNPLRVSATLLSYYQKGDIGSVIDYLLGKQKEPTPAMQRGSDIHRQMEAMGVPDVIKEIYPEYSNFKTENKLEIKLSEDVVLVGIVDLELETHDGIIIVDYKTGKMNGYELQLSFYTWLYEKLDKEVRSTILAHVGEDLEIDDMKIDFEPRSMLAQEVMLDFMNWFSIEKNAIEKYYK